MRGYTQLTRDERYQIYALRKAGHSQKEIAEVLRRNPSTISRELGRNKGLKALRHFVWNCQRFSVTATLDRAFPAEKLSA